jgi:hypothetical protein
MGQVAGGFETQETKSRLKPTNYWTFRLKQFVGSLREDRTREEE